MAKSRITHAADAIWVQLYLACIADRIEWGDYIYEGNLQKTFPRLAELGVTSKNAIRMGIEDLPNGRLIQTDTDHDGHGVLRLTLNGYRLAEATANDPKTRFGAAMASLLASNTDNTSADESLATEINADDKWEPLPLDRSSPTFEDMLAKLEEVKEEFRKENGFASVEPEKKTALLDALENGYQTLKSKVVTRAAIEALVLNPLRVLVSKFSTAAIGELAKIAVAAVKSFFGI